MKQLTPGTLSLTKAEQLTDLLQKAKIVECHNISEFTVEEFLELTDRKNLKLSYHPRTKKIKIVMPKWIRSGCLNWFKIELRTLETRSSGPEEPYEPLGRKS